MSNTTLKQDAVVPFIKLLETNGLLHNERFVGMGIHEDRLFLLKANVRPERVVISDHSFAFLNKKADGPNFEIGNNQTRDDAARAYAFHGKDAGGFTDFMMIPESEMQRVLMIAALKKALESTSEGEKPDLRELVGHMFSQFGNNPEMTELLMQEDPTITREEAEVASELLGGDMLGAALAELAVGSAQPQKPVDFTQVLPQEAAAVESVAEAMTSATAKPTRRSVAPVESALASFITTTSINRRMLERFGFIR
ncbi:hypothetical protein D3C71_435920 [compost metagenome]